MRATLQAAAAILGFYAVALWPVLIALAVLPASWWAGPSGILIQSCVLLLGAALASALFVERGWASPEMLGIRGALPKIRGFGFGALVGVLMAYAAIGLAVVGGSASLSFETASVIAYLRTALVVGGVLLVAALAEELLFRGYPIARLAKAVGRLRASLALAMVFLLAHALNPEVTVFGLLNIGLAALVLSAAFFGQGGLAAAWGLHVGWNGGLGITVDAPVSGVDLEMPMVDFITGGPAWFTGGSFGPEGGLVSTIAMTAVLLWLLRKLKTSERMV